VLDLVVPPSLLSLLSLWVLLLPPPSLSLPLSPRLRLTWDLVERDDRVGDAGAGLM
jgi:hypothetical protein